MSQPTIRTYRGDYIITDMNGKRLEDIDWSFLWEKGFPCVIKKEVPFYQKYLKK